MRPRPALPLTASSQGGLRRLRFFLGAVHADQFSVLEEAVHGALDAEELGCQGGDFRGVHFLAPLCCRCVYFSAVLRVTQELFACLQDAPTMVEKVLNLQNRCRRDRGGCQSAMGFKIPCGARCGNVGRIPTSAALDLAGADSQGGSQFGFSQHLILQTIRGYWGSAQAARRTLGSRQRGARLPVLAPKALRWRVLWLGGS